MTTRIYLIVDTSSDKPERLVRANSKAQAIRHVAEDTFLSRVATQDDLELLLTRGDRVEIAAMDEPKHEVES